MEEKRDYQQCGLCYLSAQCLHKRLSERIRGTVTIFITLLPH